MPSPFPGMDPFLEHPVVFPGLHDSLIIYLKEYLQPRLPEPYFAETGDRVWVEVSQRFIASDGDPVLVRVPHDERREPFLNIYSRSEGERLVCTIEVLSPASKTPGDQGRDLYLRKQRELLRGQAHLVEIDLLRSGQHTTAVPLDMAVAKAGSFDYHVCVHPFESIEDFFVYPIHMQQPLPEVNIPLLPGDPVVPVDLQAVFDRCYDTGPYHRRIRYGEWNIVPPLTPEQAAWATQLLRAQGRVPPA